ncbi:RHS repeat-associated core domain-containing protein [Chitinophaga filiformis]|uniref:RHS repeat-associated core domain-containing protein n=1 Tax=Chitinophaga filiformis TaxID=104663 RepID=A0A1G8CDL5_CHIFI|nr:RHS repeat-associated core domain-containing protein [Chitinophaga filiformis]
MKGEGNQQDYGIRVYDPRLGKFLSVDPITAKYPELTPYQFASNRVIDGIDLDGLEHLRYDELKEAIKSHPLRLENGSKISNPFLRGLYNTAKVLAPLRPLDDKDPQTAGEVVENLKELPTNLSKIPSSLKKLYTEGTLDQK